METETYVSEYKFLEETVQREKSRDIKRIVNKINIQVGRSKNPDITLEIQENELKNI